MVIRGVRGDSAFFDVEIFSGSSLLFSLSRSEESENMNTLEFFILTERITDTLQSIVWSDTSINLVSLDCKICYD